MILQKKSCTTEKPIIINDEEDNYYVNHYNDWGFKIIDDIVYFKDRVAFEKVISDLHQHDEQYLDLWELKYGFDYSYRGIFKPAITKESEHIQSSDKNYIIEDPVFATVVNRDGIYIISDTIHIITYEKEYTIPDLDFSLIDKVLIQGSDKTKLQSNGVQIFDINRKTFYPNIKDVTGLNVVKKQHPLDANLSAHLKCWCVNYLVYGSIGIRIVGRKYDEDHWRNDRMVYAKVDGCAWGGPSWSPPVEYCGSNYGYDEKKVAKTLLWYTGIVYCEEVECTYTYQDGPYPNIYQWTITWN
ncbi:MAG: hypothetical protein ACQERS_01835 [Bacteroidota bacterium]